MTRDEARKLLESGVCLENINGTVFITRGAYNTNCCEYNCGFMSFDTIEEVLDEVESNHNWDEIIEERE